LRRLKGGSKDRQPGRDKRAFSVLWTLLQLNPKVTLKDGRDVRTKGGAKALGKRGVDVSPQQSGFLSGFSPPKRGRAAVSTVSEKLVTQRGPSRVPVLTERTGLLTETGLVVTRQGKEFLKARVRRLLLRDGSCWGGGD